MRDAVARIRELEHSGSPPPAELLAALMVIEDAVEAIRAYGMVPEFKTTGEAYLLKFGLLQAFQLAFDAAEGVGRSLGIKVRADREIGGKAVLLTRNLVAGHPIGGNLNGARWNHFHDRQTAMSRDVIKVMSFKAADSDVWTGQTVIVAQLISDGLSVITGLLNGVIRSALGEGE